MTILVDHKRTVAVLDAIMKRYKENGAPYDLPHVVLPQDPRHLPKQLSVDPKRQAMFFFVLCYWMRGGTNSVEAARKLSQLFIRHPDYFDADISSAFSDTRLILPLQTVGLMGMINSSRVQWPENSRRLLDHYDGDPRNIFTGVTSYQELCERVRNRGKGRGFVGFQKKMTSMLAYYFIDQKLVPAQPFPIPVDFHLMRLALANEIVKVDPHAITGNMLSEELEDTLRELFYAYAQDRGIDHLELCNALWLLGSSLCSNQPGNRAKQGVYEGRATEIDPIPYLETPSQLQRLAGTCGICPLTATCTSNYPSPYYYRRGIIVRTGSRPLLPSESAA